MSGFWRGFFLARDLLERSLPRMKAPIQHVMECVANITKKLVRWPMQSSLHLWIFAWLVALRPEQGLEIIKGSPAQFMDFIVSIIVAGTRIDMGQYFLVAIRLTSHEDIEIRKRGNLLTRADTIHGAPGIICKGT